MYQSAYVICVNMVLLILLSICLAFDVINMFNFLLFCSKWIWWLYQSSTVTRYNCMSEAALPFKM